MKRSFAVTILFAAGCAGTAQRSDDPAGEHVLAAGSPDLPNDVRQVADRLVSCTHFAGEINGDRSKRDKEVASIMAELRCDTIDEDADAIRQKYAGDRAVQEALMAASEQ